MSSLDSRRLIRAHVVIPPAGGWWADLTLSDGGAPTLARATLTIGDLDLVGTVIHAGIDAPDQPRAVMQGGAGWDALLTRAGVYGGGSVRLSTVLRDLAAMARTDPADASTAEPYDAPTETILGDAYEWPLSVATAPLRCRGVLSALVRRGAIPTWRVATSGRTRFDAWPTLGAADAFGRLMDPRNLGRGVRRYALDTRAGAFLPGATVEGATIARVEFREDAGALMATTWEA